ncbi:sensor histidine kinase [Butyrivibrio sp. LC3010]|uniref:sensor histidine kinase n=1 Tax=Butyrivibrio sp. LC3010 TaxID=1280680 RepID=UPI0006778E3E|nr:histidine kinase [Butyrivibrio sp. LC3010]
MKNLEKRRAYTVVQILRKTLWSAIPVVIIFVIISSFSFLEIRKQNNLAVENAVNIYQTELEGKLNAVAHFVQWTVVHDPILDSFSLDNSIGIFRQAGNDLRLRVSDMQYSTGSEFMYFFYWDQGNIFMNASELKVSYKTYKAIRKRVIMDTVKIIGAEGFSWNTCVVDGVPYLYYQITYNHRTFVAFVAAEDIVAPLSKTNLGRYGNIKLQNLNDESFYETAESPRGFLSYYYNKLYFPGEKSGLPFTLVIDSDMLGSYGKIFLLQFLVFLTALALSVIMGGYILATYKRVILPIKIFSSNLSKMDSISDTASLSLDLTDSKIQELNQINDQFKSLIHEITRLKINIYEAELDQNKFRILFLQQQIKPHFYLNCLTTIDSMLSLGDVSAAQKMLQFTSKYFRYLFQADKDFVPLSSEIAHAEDYLDIQMMRLSDDIEYTCDIDEKDFDVLIPPLLVISFVENIIKYAEPNEDSLKISITGKDYMRNGEDYLEISIRDNGQGFPSEVIEKIRNGEYLTIDGARIGITNCIRRLKLLYNDDFEFRLENMENGGGVVILGIPKNTAEQS